MEMPRPTPAHQRLAKIAGSWRGKETMHPSPWDPNGGVADAVTHSRVALGGFSVVADYTQSRGGTVTFEGHGVYTTEPRTPDQVVLYWFDSIGQGIEEFRGGWQGDALTMTSKNAMGHARLTYDYSQPGVLVSAMDMSPDGSKWSRLFDGRYQRVD